MILYLTKDTFDKYKLKMPEDMLDPISKTISRSVIDKEANDPLLEWGGKLFYFERKKCIQFVNFASKFTLFFIDVKMSDIKFVSDTIIRYLLDIYSNNQVMVLLIKRLADEYPYAAFSLLKNKSCIATLNKTQLDIEYDENMFYNYIYDGVFHTRELNKDINYKYLQSFKEGKNRNYFYPGKKFEELLKKRYNN